MPVYKELEWFVGPSGSQVLAHCDDGIDRMVCHLSLIEREAALRRGELIAAAPLMLDALEGLAALPAHFQTCGLCKGGYMTICNVAQDSVARCQKALAQARKGQAVPA